MANSPSTIVSISSIHNMPTDVDAAKHQTPKHHELAPSADSIAPSHYQKVGFFESFCLRSVADLIQLMIMCFCLFV